MLVSTSPGEVTELLQRVSAGDKSAEGELFPQIYAELKRMAEARMRRERCGHTLQATALVNEAYLRLTNQRQVEWQGRTHFFAVAAQCMRRILADHARHRNAGKRGGDVIRVEFDESLGISNEQCSLIASLDEALTRLEQLNPRYASIVELRFFGGLTEDQVASILGFSARTVKRDWTLARAWLYAELKQ